MPQLFGHFSFSQAIFCPFVCFRKSPQNSFWQALQVESIIWKNKRAKITRKADLPDRYHDNGCLCSCACGFQVRRIFSRPCRSRTYQRRINPDRRQICMSPCSPGRSYKLSCLLLFWNKSPSKSKIKDEKYRTGRETLAQQDTCVTRHLRNEKLIILRKCPFNTNVLLRKCLATLKIYLGSENMSNKKDKNLHFGICPDFSAEKIFFSGRENVKRIISDSWNSLLKLAYFWKTKDVRSDCLDWKQLCRWFVQFRFIWTGARVWSLFF